MSLLDQLVSILEVKLHQRLSYTPSNNHKELKLPYYPDISLYAYYKGYQRILREDVYELAQKNGDKIKELGFCIWNSSNPDEHRIKDSFTFCSCVILHTAIVITSETLRFDPNNYQNRKKLTSDDDLSVIFMYNHKAPHLYKGNIPLILGKSYKKEDLVLFVTEIMNLYETIKNDILFPSNTQIEQKDIESFKIYIRSIESKK